MEKLLTWFINGWCIAVLIFNVIGIIGLFIGADSFWEGWKRMTEIFSPFNVINFFAEVITISPALGAYYWREKIRKRKLSN